MPAVPRFTIAGPYLAYKKEIVLEFFKFALVGLVGTCVNIILLYLFTEYLGIYYIFSALFSFVFTVTLNFFLNKMWTFREKISYKTKDLYVKFFTVSIFSFLVSLFFLYIFTEFMNIYYIISQVMAIGISLIINFIGNKIWTFNQ